MTDGCTAGERKKNVDDRETPRRVLTVCACIRVSVYKEETVCSTTCDPEGSRPSVWPGEWKERENEYGGVGEAQRKQ